MPTEGAVVELARLCPHLATRTFQTEHRHLYLDLRAYESAFNDGDETLVFVLVSEEQVVAYIAIVDQELLHPDRGPVRCFALPAMAVAEQSQHSNAALRLALKARRVLDLRQETHVRAKSVLRYDGIAAVPWTDRLAETLLRLGFEPIPGEMWWFRPWEQDEDDLSK